MECVPGRDGQAWATGWIGLLYPQACLAFFRACRQFFVSNRGHFLNHLTRTLLVHTQVLLAILPSAGGNIEKGGGRVGHSFAVSSRMVFNSHSPVLAVALTDSATLMRSTVYAE